VSAVEATAPSPAASPRGEGTPLVEVVDLVKHFPVKMGVMQRTGAWVQAVDHVSFEVRKGETLGLVGESGCGKTTVGRLILRLIDPTSGTIRFDGADITGLTGSKLRPYRRRMQIIFQDPFASLDPRQPIGDSIGEGLRIHKLGSAQERRAKVARMMDLVGLQPYHARRYPHEFSGGQRQRIGIARALVLEPDLIICDEPVSALDVSIQAQVLNLLKTLQRELGLTYVFVAHNMGVVEHISDRVAVMYLGRVVELADRRDLFRKQEHPYTEALMSAIPVPNPELRRQRIILKGDVPSPLRPPSGCRFHPRCQLRASLGNPEICAAEEPELVDGGGQHFCACHFRGPNAQPLPAPR
jgi:peptide/nickel transport system ATP-binding protein/oligopeptide transport system ATP-binding protein